MMKPNRLLTAGKELIKLNFGNAVKSLLPQSDWKSDVFSPGSYSRAMAETWDDSGTIFYHFTCADSKSYYNAYKRCPPVTAIINRKAQARINGKTWVMNTQGKEATSEIAKKLRKLTTRPNPLQSWKQFEAQTYIYEQIFGFAIILPIIPVGYQKYGPIEATSLWNIPPYMVEIEESDDLYYERKAKQIKKITLTYRNNKTEIDPDTIFIIKDFSPSFTSLIIPESRILSLQMPINNIIGALESENVIINRRGPDFIVSNEKDQFGITPIDPKERAVLETHFNRYGIRKGQQRAVFTSAAVKYSKVGFNMKELLLHESVKENAQHICDGLNYPPHLLGLIDPTFNNQNAAEKGLYNNAIIPEAQSDYEQLNQIFRTEEYNIKLDKDFCEIPVLQADKKEQADARKILVESLDKEYKNNWITLNRVLELLNEDTIGVEGDKYYRDLVQAGNPLGVDATGQLITQSTSANGNGQYQPA